jgi:rhomboid family GlyGly-CTERM serine protease
MLNLPTQTNHLIAPLCIVLVSIALLILEPFTSDWFTYDRQLIEDFEWWRIISGHFLHTNLNHRLLNILGVALLWALHGQYYQTGQYLLLFLILCLGTSISLYVFTPSLIRYVGLSGVLHGLFIVGAYLDIKHKFKTGWLLLIGIWIKVLHEQFFGASAQVAQLISANVAIDAHLYGTISGTVVIFGILMLKQIKS